VINTIYTHTETAGLGFRLSSYNANKKPLTVCHLWNYMTTLVYACWTQPLWTLRSTKQVMHCEFVMELFQPIMFASRENSSNNAFPSWGKVDTAKNFLTSD